MKKVALAFSGSFMGGAEAVMIDVLRILQASGYQVDILLNRKGEVDKVLNSLDSKPSLIGRTNISNFASWSSPFSYLVNLYRTAAFIFRSKSEVYLVEGKLLTQVFSPIGKLFGKKVVSYVHYPPSAYEVRRCFYAQASRLLFCAGALGRYFVEAGVENKKFSVVRNYVDSQRFQPVEEKEALRTKLKQSLYGLDKDSIVVCLVGHLSQIKGQAELLQALKRADNPKIKVVFAGADNHPDSINETKLKNLVNQLELSSQVLFLGKVSDVVSVYRSSDIMVLPSHKEGLPLCVLEAMACELPVIASKVDGTPEAVKEGETGVLSGGWGC